MSPAEVVGKPCVVLLGCCWGWLEGNGAGGAGRTILDSSSSASPSVARLYHISHVEPMDR